ncbi:hypothetical protein BIM11_5840 [Burkholderia pseudomallei]|nr:hypothetical protein BIM11_5840 [Burkholderia pseudomallei]
MPCSLPSRYTCVPTAVEPTNEIAFTSGCEHSASTTSLPPCTTLSTPFGTPASIASSTSCIVDSGSCSDGFSTNVLPQTIAIGNIHSGIIAGKLNGVMPTHTPSGWRSVYVSTPPATFSANSPSCSVPTEHACSTTSRPRNTSPSASGSVLPCSAVSVFAICGRFARTRSWNFSMMRMRAEIGVLFHFANAACAASTAAPTSATVENGTRASSS